MPTRVKICGITRPEDAALAAELGADAIGLNFVAGPRKIELGLARRIAHTLPPLVTPVALVSMDVHAFQPHDIYNSAHISVFQLYAADPTWRFYEGEVAYWWVRSIDARDALTQVAVDIGSRPTHVDQSMDPRVPLMNYAQGPSALLLDKASPDKLGGTGKTFNWHWIAEAREAGELHGLPPIILAGGLTPDNVAEAIRIAKPYAVDVSSGVEIPGKPGIKDPIKMRDFIQAAKSAL